MYLQLHRVYSLCIDLLSHAFDFWIDVKCTVPCGESRHHGVLVKQYTKKIKLFLACPHSAVNISKYCRREMLLKKKSRT